MVTASCWEALSCRKGRLEKFDRLFHRIKKKPKVAITTAASIYIQYSA